MSKEQNYHKLFMDIAIRSAEMSFCERAKVGAVLVKDNRVLVNAWNGTPSGMDNTCEKTSYSMVSICCSADIREEDGLLYCGECNEEIGFVDDIGSKHSRWVGKITIKKKVVTNHSIVIHAEANAILFAAKNGISTDGCTLYVTLSPCPECCKLIAQSGIKKVIYNKEYRNTEGLDFLKQLGVEILHFTKEEE